jgi:hypothetical protein
MALIFNCAYATYVVRRINIICCPATTIRRDSFYEGAEHGSKKILQWQHKQ